MTEFVKSKRHFFKFYVLTFFVSLLWIYMACALFIIAAEKYAILYIGAASLVVVAVYTAIVCFKNAPIIYVDEKIIKFNNAIYYWSDIEKVNLTGKQPYRYMINQPFEGMALKFKDGKMIYAYDNNYTNLWQIKSFIKQVILDREPYYVPLKVHQPKSVNFDNALSIKGSLFFSFRGVVAWSLPLFLLVLFILDSNKSKSGALPIAIISFLWLTANSFLLYYFAVSSHYLLVKNHHFLWIRKIIPLTDIKEVIFETRGKLPNYMTVVTNDFRKQIYPAGTLRDKQWRALLTVLRKNKVKVRNEIGI